MPIAAPDTTLTAIQIKVRRLTRTPSEDLLTTSDLNNYINTFIVYDFPEHLRTFFLNKPFTFYCNAFQDTYNLTDTTLPPTSPLYDFLNNYLTVDGPLYIAGYQSWYSQSREQFYTVYPLVNNLYNFPFVGDGVTTTFSGNALGNSNSFTPSGGGAILLRNNVTFSSIDINGNGLVLIDTPITNTTGNLIVPNDQTPFGTINYITGLFTLTFATAPAVGAPISAQTVPMQPSIPQAMLFFDNQFTLRPVPNQPYAINFQVQQRPVQFLENSDSPQLKEWWQYIAYGAAKKIFEDKMDTESVQAILPEYEEQKRLVLRRTLVQQSTQRTPSIYTGQTGLSASYGAWGFGNGPF